MKELLGISLTDWASIATVFCALILVIDILKARTKKLKGGKKKSKAWTFVKIVVVLVLIGVAVAVFFDSHYLSRIVEPISGK